ncbi:hypothetical protein V6N13_133476 [Hibiscus sabdariffa]
MCPVFSTGAMFSEYGVFDSGLFDLDYVGSAFTWYWGNCSVRLDRCFGNATWFDRYPVSSLHHLLRMKSEHRPILLSFSVKEKWNTSLPIADAIKLFSSSVEAWNRDIFGIIGKHKKILMARLRGVQRSLDQSRTRSMIKLEYKLLQELETVLDQEEQLWKKKS